MGNVNPSCMQAFRVKWDGVCGQQRTALGSFVLIFILFPVSVTGYMPSIVHHLTLILYKIKNSSTRMDHTQCSPFNFPNEITEETPPRLVPVISEWTVIYFTVPFGWSSTSLWSTFQHLHFTLETSVGWYVCPLGLKCWLCVSVFVPKRPFSLLKITSAHRATQIVLDREENARQTSRDSTINHVFNNAWSFSL